MSRVFLLVVVLPFAGYTQDTLLTDDVLIPDHALKVSPLHLFNFYPTFQISYETQVGANTTLQVEGGYVMEYGGRDDYQNRRGVKARLEGRYYLERVRGKNKLFYVAGELHANFVNFERRDWIVDCFDIECNNPFTQERQYGVRYREQGITAKFGLLRYFGHDARVFIDLGVGATLRNIRYHKPVSGGNSFDGFFFTVAPNEENRFAGRPYVGVRFGYRLR